MFEIKHRLISFEGEKKPEAYLDNLKKVINYLKHYLENSHCNARNTP